MFIVNSKIMLSKKFKSPTLLICFFLIIIFMFYEKINKNLNKIDKTFLIQISEENGNAFINLDRRVKTISLFVKRNNFPHYKLHESLKKNPNISHRVTEILWPIKRIADSNNLFIISNEIKNNNIICSEIIVLKDQISYCKLR